MFAAAITGSLNVYFAHGNGKPSVCHGSPASGSLTNAKRPPYSGGNYRSYTIAGFLAGRTFMHSAVRDALVDAYMALAQSDPDLRFVYAESGWPWGGPFRPHKTHQNGTSVDFMVPLSDAGGHVAEMPASVFNYLGYNIHFDDSGHGTGTASSLNIDFDAIAKHLLALDAAAVAHGIRIDRVILEPPLQHSLFAAPLGHGLDGKLPFMKKPAWFRHDQHYHVDFAVACK